jgi:iron complex transport system ATP-binding protein
MKKLCVEKITVPPIISSAISFALSPGLHICLGKNGSGKTTLLRSLTACFKQSQGQVLYHTDAISQESVSQESILAIDLLSYPPQLKAKILSYLPQNPPFNPYQLAIDCVLQGRYPYQTQESKSKSLEYAWAQMKRLAIDHLGLRQMKTLSGGERQKVLIARLLTQNTEILLIDEPLNHLDFQHQIDVLQTLKSLACEKIILCVMHDLNLSLQCADSFLLMDQRELRFQGHRDDFLSSQIFKEIFGDHWILGTHPISHQPYLFLKT